MTIIKVKEIHVADTFLKRFLGYMFKSKPEQRELMIIEPCNSIHTFFMKFSIDVLFLNQEDQVIDIRLGLEKGQMIMPVKGAYKVVEAKAGMFNGVRKGELIRFEILNESTKSL